MSLPILLKFRSAVVIGEGQDAIDAGEALYTTMKESFSSALNETPIVLDTSLFEGNDTSGPADSISPRYDPYQDLLVLVARSASTADVIKQMLKKYCYNLSKASVSSDSTSSLVYMRDLLNLPKCIIMCSGEATNFCLAIAEDVTKEMKWMCSIASTTHLCPPYLQNKIPTFGTYLQGPLENVCLGIALGVTRHLNFSASTPFPVTPIDVCTNVAFLSLCLLSHRIMPATVGNQLRVLVEIGTESPSKDEMGNAPGVIVWGMIGEYANDYFGRHRKEISAAIPAPNNFFTNDPTLGFNFNFSDLLNYGIHLSTPIHYYQRYLSNVARSHIRKFPHSTSTERLKDALNRIEATTAALQFVGGPISSITQTVTNLQNVTLPGGYPNLDDSKFVDAPRTPDFRMYTLFSNIICRDPQLQHFLPSVLLSYIHWETYIKNVCVGVLRYSACAILNLLPSEVVLPVPSLNYTNDFIFTGNGRSPEPPMRLRKYFPDVFWTIRSGQQSTGVKVTIAAGGTKQRRQDILAQPQVQLMMSQIAKEQNVDKKAIVERASKILKGIGDNLNVRDISIMSLVIRKVFKLLYNRINVNSIAQSVLFNAFRRPRTAVVVIPTHRSYVDFLSLSYVMLTMGFRPPHVCAGEDFLKLGGIAELMRGSGAFFMRRTFRGDRLYGGLFKEYVRHLIRNRQCVEFFIEGMRSRTGKTVTPKLGILKMITDAFFEKQEEIDDVIFIPISLSYEKVLEANVYAEELLGIPKPKETISNLIKSVSILKSDYGAMNVSFGHPISLAQLASNPFIVPAGYEPITADQSPPKVGESQASLAGPSGSYTPIRTLQSLAWLITYELQQNIYVTPTALLAATIINNISSSKIRGECMKKTSVTTNVEWLRTTLLHRKGKMCDHFAAMDGEELVTYAIKYLSPHLTVNLHNVIIVNDQLSTTVLLSNYANQLIHVFQDEALVCVAVFGYGNEIKLSQNSEDGDNQSGDRFSDFTITHNELKKRILSLQMLLSNELPNFHISSPISFESWLSRTLSLLHEANVLIHTPLSDAPDEQLRFKLNRHSSFVAQQVYPYIESTYITLLAAVALIESNEITRVEANVLAKLAHEGAKTLHMQGLNDYNQCCVQDNIKNSIAKMVELGFFHREMSPAVLYTISISKQRALRDYMAEVNRMRCHPANEGTVEKALEILRSIRSNPTFVSPKAKL